MIETKHHPSLFPELPVSSSNNNWDNRFSGKSATDINVIIQVITHIAVQCLFARSPDPLGSFEECWRGPRCSKYQIIEIRGIETTVDDTTVDAQLL